MVNIKVGNLLKQKQIKFNCKFFELQNFLFLIATESKTLICFNIKIVFFMYDSKRKSRKEIGTNSVDVIPVTQLRISDFKQTNMPY